MQKLDIVYDMFGVRIGVFQGPVGFVLAIFIMAVVLTAVYSGRFLDSNPRDPLGLFPEKDSDSQPELESSENNENNETNDQNNPSNNNPPPKQTKELTNEQKDQDKKDN